MSDNIYAGATAGGWQGEVGGRSQPGACCFSLNLKQLFGPHWSSLNLKQLLGPLTLVFSEPKTTTSKYTFWSSLNLKQLLGLYWSFVSLKQAPGLVTCVPTLAPVVGRQCLHLIARPFVSTDSLNSILFLQTHSLNDGLVSFCRSVPPEFLQ